jgi:hypothetical protein
MTIIGRKTGSNLPALSEPRHFPLAAPLADELALALQFARAEKSSSTRRAYRADFDAFRIEHQPSKLMTRVRFPSPAPIISIT